MALLSGALMGVLTQRPAWVGFRKEKETQRAKLAELEKMEKRMGAEKKGRRVGGGRGRGFLLRTKCVIS
eukprot:CAMPEP_0181387594 /NCGR_PEP_ID=MMETSP1106-20121128/23809_1 /TAXON_ID=81844 /ORGANISM="Mantoniella antarctica, Strain SL-175" /LENGTH=68 /DNA_ID=CAMNT_0023507997 /DNA_START=14 /DNA_END=220 /DNA_ORIENTATION=+